jgi:hypothetical protein
MRVEFKPVDASDDVAVFINGQEVGRAKEIEVIKQYIDFDDLVTPHRDVSYFDKFGSGFRFAV